MRRLRIVFCRVSALFRRQRIERDIEAEMQFHIAMRTQDNIATSLAGEPSTRNLPNGYRLFRACET